jgi:hypothetical protein
VEGKSPTARGSPGAHTATAAISGNDVRALAYPDRPPLLVRSGGPQLAQDENLHCQCALLIVLGLIARTVVRVC